MDRNDAVGLEHEGMGHGQPRSPDGCPRFEGSAAAFQREGEGEDEYYETIAEQLRFVETCRIDSARSLQNVNSTPAMACGLVEFEWLAQCIYPWEIEFSRNWQGARSKYLGLFKPGQLMMYTSGVLGAAFEDVETAQTRLLDHELASVRSVRLLVDGKVVNVGEYVLAFDARSRDNLLNNSNRRDTRTATIIFIEVVTRLYFPTGVHHAVVLATSVVDGHVRFLQFWFEMQHAYDDGLLELQLRARALRQVDGPADPRESLPTESWHDRRDVRFVTCCDPAGAVHYHTKRDAWGPVSITDGDP